MTIAYPPERVLTELERADEAARLQRARSGQLRPRTLHALCQQAARLLQCPGCGQKPGRACADAGGQDGYHLARFAQARRRGLLTADEMAMVLAAAGDVFTNATTIQDGGR
jgi:hypothetical protein